MKKTIIIIIVIVVIIAGVSAFFLLRKKKPSAEESPAQESSGADFLKNMIANEDLSDDERAEYVKQAREMMQSDDISDDERTAYAQATRSGTTRYRRLNDFQKYMFNTNRDTDYTPEEAAAFKARLRPGAIPKDPATPQAGARGNAPAKKVVPPSGIKVSTLMATAKAKPGVVKVSK